MSKKDHSPKIINYVIICEHLCPSEYVYDSFFYGIPKIYFEKWLSDFVLILWKLMGASDVWLPMFLKISSFVF